jgi:tetratricopeptide (TPR) repeat protein
MKGSFCAARASRIWDLQIIKGAVNAFTEALGKNYLLPQAVDYDMDYYLAVAYDKAGEPDKAIGVYNAIISVKPDACGCLLSAGLR